MSFNSICLPVFSCHLIRFPLQWHEDGHAERPDITDTVSRNRTPPLPGPRRIGVGIYGEFIVSDPGISPRRAIAGALCITTFATVTVSNYVR